MPEPKTDERADRGCDCGCDFCDSEIRRLRQEVKDLSRAQFLAEERKMERGKSSTKKQTRKGRNQMKRENVEHDLDSLIHMNGEWVTVKREVEIDMLKGVIALLDKNQELKDQVDILEDRKSLWEAKWELQSAANPSGP